MILAKTYRTPLNTNGEGRHSCLVLDLRGNVPNFAILCMILAVILSFIALSGLRNVTSVPNLFKIFIIKRCCSLSGALGIY